MVILQGDVCLVDIPGCNDSNEMNKLLFENHLKDAKLVLSGVFFQLPPVIAKHFAFESKSWKSAEIQMVELMHIIRQTDEVFMRLKE